MAQLQQTPITGSLNISGSSLVMPLLTGSTDVHSGSAGQLWINNEGSLNLKFTQNGSFGTQNSPFSCLGAWSAGGNILAAKDMVGGIGDSQNASLMVGGWPAPVTYHYNGTSWSSGGSLINTVAPNDQTAGTENAGIRAGGFNGGDPGSENTEEYNGSTWASGGTLIQARYSGGGAGVQNAMILVAGDGNPSSPYIRDCVEEYNGLSWTAGNAYYRQDRGLGVTGTQTATLAWGGYGAPVALLAYAYDGTAWSQVNSSIQPNAFGLSFGTANTALGNAGYCSPSVRDCPQTTEWNGNTWSVGCNMAQGRRSVAGSGTTVSGLAAGGKCGTPSSTAQVLTEEYTKDLLQPFTYNAAASTDSWSGGPNIIVGRTANMSAGSTSAAITFGGQCAGGPGRVSLTEEFDGTSFSAGGALINDNSSGGSAGTQNATLMAGGLVPPTYKNITEEYNGSAWSAGNAIITTRGYMAGWGGTQDAAYIAGGYPAFTCTEEYDGTNWATGGALSAATYLGTGGGTQNAGIIAGGTQPGSSAYYATSYHYDGSAWSAGGTMSTARGYTVGGGLQNDFTAGGGLTPAYVSCTERYNGTTWCSVATQPLNIYLNQSAPNCGGSNSLSIGGYTPSPSAGFSKSTLFYCEIQDICSTTAYALCAWTGAAPLITDKTTGMGAGTQNAALAAGGFDGPAVTATTEEYNGTSWAAQNALITARGYIWGNGTQNAAVGYGGDPNVSPSNVACTEEYDGTNWSAGGNLSVGRQRMTGDGTQNDTLAAGGYCPASYRTCVENYNGSSWSTGTALPSAAGNAGFAGTQNAGVIFGGISPSYLSGTNKWNGSAWDASSNLPFAFGFMGVAGTANDALSMGGYSPGSNNSTTLVYNGLTWSCQASLGVARNGGMGTGTSTAAILAGGGNNASIPNTELFTCDSTVTISAWNTVASITVGRASGYAGGGGGTANAGILSGGISSNSTELYNGFSWSRDVNNPLGGYGVTAGTQDAYKQTRNSADVDSHLDYNGTAWSTNTCSPVGGRSASGAGTQNSFIQFGGFSPAPGSSTETWNGSAWSSGGTMINGMYYNTGAGTVNDAASIGGYNGAYRSCHEKYNGSTWSTSTANNYTTGGAAGSGNDTEGYFTAGGSVAANSSLAYLWNGYAWESMSGGMAHARSWSKGNGDAKGALVISGEQESSAPDTESWTSTNPVNLGLYCFVKNLAPGATDSSGISYSTGY